MKLDSKKILMAVGSFVAGFLLCLLLLRPSPMPQRISPVVVTGPVMASTQFQPQTFHIVLPQSESPRMIIRDIVRDPLEEIEMMKHRSVDLIDTRYQPQIDLKGLDK